MSDKPYKLKHTAKVIDHKLELIDENKNLLPYPYITTFSEGLENVGDGSILVSANAVGTQNILLNTCTLPKGKYKVSLDITDIVEVPVLNPYFSLSVSSAGTLLASTNDDTAAESIFELAAETAVEVYLNTESTNLETNLLLKPQIEAGTEKTAWVPYMNTIGTYVDERFNSTNTKVKVLTQRLNELTTQLDTLTAQLKEITSLTGAILVVEDE